MVGWDGDALARNMEEALEQQIASVNSLGERN